ncbi:MAG TPA: lipocalin-like domain-containing protein [Myxococcaceae bacterium]
MRRAPVLVACVLWGALEAGCHSGEVRPEPVSLAGTWRLEVADKLLPDGTRAPDYGAHPDGRLMIDAQGRYALLIFKAERPDFASPEKALGTDAEFRAAALGTSCHHGTVRVDPAAGTLTFVIEDATFPNWRGRTQVRAYELHGDVLSYRVPARSDGSVPISVWRRER